MSDLMLQIAGMMGKRSGGDVVYALFDPLLTDPVFTISGDGRTLTGGSDAFWANAILNQQKTSGKWSLVINANINLWSAGLRVGTTTEAKVLGSDGLDNGIGYAIGSGNWVQDLPTFPAAGLFWDANPSAPMSILMIIDADNNTAAFLDNGGTFLKPSTRPIVAPYISIQCLLSSQVSSVNTGQDPFSPAEEALIVDYETTYGVTVNRGVYV